jgi:tRNA dimethylallyltransferase
LSPDSSPLFLALVGPTAVGKTELALDLADRLRTDILSVDSMQVYRGMNIGTAKPSLEERRGIPHHLIDVADPRDLFSVSDYLDLAVPILQRHWEEKKPLVLCGGTGLYFKALSEGLAESPPPDREFRRSMEQQADIEGTGGLYDRLSALDSASATRIHPNDRKRIIRALEIHHQTGLTKSEYEARQTPPVWSQAFRWLGLRRNWEDLDTRIDRRVEAMLDQGLEREVRSLLEQGLTSKNTAMQALGYKEMVDYLQGKAILEESVQLIQQRTRRFARRQMSWFRPMIEIEWWDLPSPSSPDLVGVILEKTGLP